MTSLSTVDLAKEINYVGVLNPDGNGNKNSLAYTIANPLSHIYGAYLGNSGDWFSLATDLWKDRWERLQKDDCFTYSLRTAFDPCPAGWRVPAWSAADERFSPWYLPSVETNTEVNRFTNHSGDWSANSGHIFDKSI